MWPVKVVLTFLALAVAGPLGGFGEVVWKSIRINPVLIVLAAGMVVLDLAAGLYRSARKGEGLRSVRFRATGWKVIEYAGVVAVGVILSAAVRRSLLPSEAALADQAALLFVIMTEAISALENLAGSKREARHLIDRVFRIGGRRRPGSGGPDPGPGSGSGGGDDPAGS